MDQLSVVVLLILGGIAFYQWKFVLPRQVYRQKVEAEASRRRRAEQFEADVQRCLADEAPERAKGRRSLADWLDEALGGRFLATYWFGLQPVRMRPARSTAKTREEV